MSTGWVKKVKTPEELELERLLKEVSSVKPAKKVGAPISPPPPAGTAGPGGPAKTNVGTEYSSGAPKAPPPPSTAKTSSYSASKSANTGATATSETDPELEALLKQLDSIPSNASPAPLPHPKAKMTAPTAPSTVKTSRLPPPHSTGSSIPTPPSAKTALKKTGLIAPTPTKTTSIPPPAKKSPFTSQRSASQASATEEMDPELEALLKKLDATPSAPVPPPALKKTSGPPPAKKNPFISQRATTQASATEEMDPELEALLKKLDATPATSKTSSYATSSPSTTTRSTSILGNRAALIKTANEAYIKAVYDRMRSMGYLENANDAAWESYLHVDWDTILSDSAFLQKYSDCTKILGRIEDTRTTKGFQTSMECFESALLEPCSGYGMDRDLLSSVTKFVITLEFIEPKFQWNKSTKVLTFIHNPLSFIDGPQMCHYKLGSEYHNGSSSNWFLPMIYIMNGNILPYHDEKYRGVPPLLDMSSLVSRSGFNSRDNPQICVSYDDDYISSSSSSRASRSSSSKSTGKTKFKCATCSGTGNWGSMHKYKTCNRCQGTGMR